MSELVAAANGPVEPTLVTIGDVIVTQSWVVTPSGTRPRREVSWTVTPMYQTTTGIPTWAIICAVVFFVFCLLGLLFLLAKEEKTTGHMQVSVQAPDFFHVAYVPVSSQMQANDVAGRVNYVRALPV
jgi:hypothetical protein